MSGPEGERLVRERLLPALFDKTKELESRQQSDLETNVFQYGNLCLSSVTLAMVFGKSPWARLSSK